MYELAKQSREKMKAKAKSLAGEKDRKVDSSDWSPASPLNAEAKTGMRPLSDRTYKKGGKVDGKAPKARADRMARKSGGRTVEKDIGVGMANKNMKEANEQRDGVKHVGALKRGGKARATGGQVLSSAAGIKDKKALGAIDPSPKRAKAEHYKSGGKIKKAGGGSFLEKIVGKPKTGSDLSQVGKMGTARYTQEDKGELNRVLRGDESLPSPNEAAESAARTGDKRGGKVARKHGGKAEKHPDVKEDKALVRKMVKKEALTGKKEGGKLSKRLGKAGGGALEMGGESKPKHRKDSKVTDIKINILAGGQKPALPMGGAMPPAPAGMPPLPPALAGAAAAPPAMPMGGLPGAPAPGIPGRKAGGRITKVAKSYKDMEAGAGSGEGRLQKEDIAKAKKGS